MAEKNTISQRISLEGADAIKLILSQIGEAGEKAFAAIKAKADASGATIGDKFSEAATTYEAAVAKVRDASGEVGLAVRALGSHFNQVGVSLGAIAKRIGLVTTAALASAAALVPVFVKLGKAAIATVGSSAQQAQALGLTIEQYSALDAVAERAGISQDRMGDAITKLNLLLAKNSSLFAGLGIATTTADGSLRSAEEVLLDLADVFQRMPDGAEKSALAVRFLGESGEDMIPFLNEGGERLRAMLEDVRRMGLGFTQADARVAKFGGEGLTRLSQALKGAKTQIGLLFAPAIGEGSNALADFIRDNHARLKELIEYVRDQALVYLKDFIALLSGRDGDVQNKWLIDARDGIVAFGTAVKDVFLGIVHPAFMFVRAAAQLVADTINRAFGTEFTANQILVGLAALKMVGAFALLGNVLLLVRSSARLLLIALTPLKLLFTALGSGLALLGRGIVVIVTGLAAIIGLPAIVTAAIVAAVAAAAVAIYVYWDEIVAAAEKAWEAIRAGAGPAFDRVKAALAEDIEEIKVLFGGIEVSAKAAFARLKQGLSDDVNEIKDILAVEIIDPEKFGDFEAGAREAFARVKKGLGEDIGEIQDILATEVVSATTWDKFVSGTAEVFANIKNDLTTDVNEIKAILDVQVVNPDTFWGDIKTSATTLWSGVEGIVTGAATRIGDAVGAVARAALAAWTGATTSVQAAAQAIVAAISTASDIAGNVAGATLLAQALVAPFIEAKGQIDKILAEIAKGSTDALAGTATAFQEAIGALPGIWQEIINQIVSAATGAGSAIVAPFAAAGAAIVSGWQGMISALDNALLSLVNKTESLLARLRSQLASLRAAIASAQSAAPRGSERFAHGGPVHGPGTATSDSIPAWLSSGEFVVRAAAVDKVGPSFLAMINSGRFSLEELFRRFSKLRMPKFNMGGMLNMPAMTMPRFAEGGLVPATASGFSGQPVYLRFGNDTVGPMQATADVVGTLMRHAVREHTLSAGRKPGRG